MDLQAEREKSLDWGKKKKHKTKKVPKYLGRTANAGTQVHFLFSEMAAKSVRDAEEENGEM